MLLTPHILAGVAIITKVPNPILGLFLVFLSHYFLDVFPQKEYSIKNMRNGRWRKSLPDFFKVFSDIGLGLLIVYLLANYNPLVLIAVFLAIFPDGLTLFYFIFPSNKLLVKHRALHSGINAIFEKLSLLF